MGKPLSFENTRDGFERLEKWMDVARRSQAKTQIMVGMEPTGHYWMTLGQFLRDRSILVVHVNPFHVKRSKELDDNSPTKNDVKDALTIARLMKDGRYQEPILPAGVYANCEMG